MKETKGPTPPVKINILNLIFLMLSTMLIFNIFMKMATQQTPSEIISFEQFIADVKKDKVKSVTFQPPLDIFGEYKSSEGVGDGKKFQTTGNLDAEVYAKVLQENNLTPSYKKPETPSTFSVILINVIPTLLFVGLLYFLFMRASNNSKGMLSSFGKAKFKTTNTHVVKFADVAGVDEAKEELQEIVDYLSNPKKYTDLGGKIPKGALLIGPSGTGKTLLAKAVAGEAGVPFLSMSGSNFIEMFVGVGASRVRDLFETARKQSPCIIFIDEIDAVAKARGVGVASANDERDQTLNQLLVEMDGFDSQSGIIVLAATNRVDVLDPAILRPGRFDRRVVVPLPDILGREKILQIHAQKVKLGLNVSLKEIARGTNGMSGADLENLINEAALLSARANKQEIDQEALEQARDKVLMGAERRSMVIPENEKKVTAYHEAGHAIIANSLKGLDLVHKVSIIPRGMALGVTQTLPEENSLSLSSLKAENMISMLMGGRVAEEIIFSHFTTGASNDIERATHIAKKMVCEWGMSSLGPINFSPDNQGGIVNVFEFSEQTKHQIDEEIRNIISRATTKTKKVLEQKKKSLEEITLLLIEKETISGEDVKRILAKNQEDQVE